MPIFKGTNFNEVIAQINADNPSMPWPIDADNFLFGPPTAIASPVNGKNTSIKITAKDSSKYRGMVEVQYHRRVLSDLFRGQTVQFTRWVNDGGSMTKAAAIDIVNQMYGINLEDAKITGSAWAVLNDGVARTWTASADNYAYTGSMQVIWRRGLQQIGLDILTVQELNGALWPDGNDFVANPDRKYDGRFLLAGLDCTEWALNNGWTASTSLGVINSTSSSALLAWINSKTGLNLNLNPYNVDTNPMGLGNASGSFGSPVALPAGAANSLRTHFIKPGFAYAIPMDLRTHPLIKAYVPLYFNI